MCSSERKFPELFKTHPTFVYSALLVPSMACKTLTGVFFGTPCIAGWAMHIRLDQTPLHSDSGVRQLARVSVVPEMCSGAKERSVGAENGSRLQAGPALTKISNCQFKFNSFQVQVDRFKYIMPMTLVHNNIY